MAQAHICDNCGKAATQVGNWRRVRVAVASVSRPADPTFGMTLREARNGHTGDYCSADCAAAAIAAAVTAGWSTAQAGRVVEDSSVE